MVVENAGQSLGGIKQVRNCLSDGNNPRLLGNTVGSCFQPVPLLYHDSSIGRVSSRLEADPLIVCVEGYRFDSDSLARMQYKYKSKISFGWEHPRDYNLRYWLFQLSWYPPVKQFRLLGFYVTISKIFSRST